MIGRVLPEGSNFEFSVPIQGLAVGVCHSGVSLNYNCAFGHDTAAQSHSMLPIPGLTLGFNISFGRIVTYGSSSAFKYVCGCTRRFLGNEAGPAGADGYSPRTYDGSHITYVGNASGGGGSL